MWLFWNHKQYIKNKVLIFFCLQNPAQFEGNSEKNNFEFYAQHCINTMGIELCTQFFLPSAKLWGNIYPPHKIIIKNISNFTGLFWICTRQLKKSSEDKFNETVLLHSGIWLKHRLLENKNVLVTTWCTIFQFITSNDETWFDSFTLKTLLHHLCWAFLACQKRNKKIEVKVKRFWMSRKGREGSCIYFSTQAISSCVFYFSVALFNLRQKLKTPNHLELDFFSFDGNGWTFCTHSHLLHQTNDSEIPIMYTKCGVQDENIDESDLA